MSEVVRVRLLLTRLTDADEPTVVAGVDGRVWGRFKAADEATWRNREKEHWGLVEESEWCEVWAMFAPDDLVRAFVAPEVEGVIASE